MNVTISKNAEGVVLKQDIKGRIAKKQPKNPQRCRINTDLGSVEVKQVEERGCDEYAHLRYVCQIENRLISFHQDQVNV
jgi:hypothetical protein